MENNNGARGANGDISDDADLDTDIDDASGDGDGKKSVSRKAYLKAVDESKRARQRAREAEEKAQRLEQEKMQASGDKDGEIKTLRQQLADEQKAKRGLQQAVVRKAVNAQLTAAATKAGCIDTDTLIRLVNISDLGEVDADTLEADQETVDAAIADLKKSKPFLFNKAGPRVNGKNPSGKVGDPPPKKKEDLSKLTTDELKARLKQFDQ